MTKQKFDVYKVRLEKEKRLIEEEIEKNIRVPDFGSDIDDEEQETDQSDAMAGQAALVSDLKTRLVDIEAALRKIKDGTYGVCEQCGGEIEEDILDIDPESRFCRRCKENI